jgi:uncharacterized Zn-binding protein involved in type VI secretion
MENRNTDTKIATSTTKEDFVQQAGSFKLSVTRNGIVLSGPNGSVTIDEGGVAIKGAIISLNGASAPVARVGDALSTGGVIATGNPTVLE